MNHRVRNWIIIVTLLALPQVIFAKSTPIADSVYINGKVYKEDAAHGWAQAVAIKDGRFIAVGDDAEIERYAGSRTVVFDLDGRMIMPGIHDMHIHPLEGTLIEVHSCSFSRSATVPEIVERVKSCAAHVPAGTWVEGGVFNARLLNAAEKLNRSYLDTAAPENPVVLQSSGGHSIWVNSEALKLSGIDRDTPDPEHGFIERSKSSDEPTGVLYEAAVELVSRQIPDYSFEQYVAAIQLFSRDLSRQGVTAIKDASTSMKGLAAYAQADKTGVLTQRVATNLTWPTESGSQKKQMAILKDRNRYRTELVNPDFAKIFVDGSAGGRKAAYLEPYRFDSVNKADYFGEFLVKPEQLNEYLVLLDRNGISVKMHCGGDAAVRAALDAIAAARRVNGDSGIPHEVAHPNLVNADDIPRFQALNAIPDLTPITWFPNPILRFLATSLGEERVQQMWQIRSFVESGAIATYGSDWPAVTPNTNPWRAMEAMITRRDPDDDNAREQFVPEQSIDLVTAIDIFTRNGAYVMGNAQVGGSIEVGKYADMIVLQDNLFEIPPEKIGDTHVILTMLGGEVVYQQ